MTEFPNDPFPHFLINSRVFRVEHIECESRCRLVLVVTVDAILFDDSDRSRERVGGSLLGVCCTRQTDGCNQVRELTEDPSRRIDEISTLQLWFDVHWWLSNLASHALIVTSVQY